MKQKWGSAQAIAFVFEQEDLKPSEKLVLLALADSVSHLKEKGALMKKTSMSREQVDAALAGLNGRLDHLMAMRWGEEWFDEH